MDKASRQFDYLWESDIAEPPNLRMATFFEDLCHCLNLERVEMSVLITDDETIRKLNAQYRDKDRATDVLSFPSLSPALADQPQHMGDIVISAQTAVRQAEAIGQSFTTELRFLCLHGTLHLLGYDHETDQGEMLRLQTDLKQRLHQYFE